jgi:hypothetical protein
MSPKEGMPGAKSAAGGKSENTETEKGLLMQSAIIGGMLVLIVIAISLGSL